MIYLYSPLNSLKEGHWFKLICGASFQHLPAVRNLSLVYALAGADCIDVAADPAVIGAVREALESAYNLGEVVRGEPSLRRLPWLMVSLNDGADPHFRKAGFNPLACPAECSQPCVAICPAQAIVFERLGDGFSGVIDQQCYGCGRCLPICPVQNISTRSYLCTPDTIGPLISAGAVDAIEIHTQVGRLREFQQLWRAIAPYTQRLKLLAVSCPDGEGLIDYLWSLYDVLTPLPCPLVWQTDGRPMSGDIGAGATRAAVKLSQKVLNAGLPGYVQLAGGTNAHTVAKLKAAQLVNPCLSGSNLRRSGNQKYVGGVAYGSFARTLLAPILDQVDQPRPQHQLEAVPALLWQAVCLARSLVSQLKPALVQQSISSHHNL